MSTVSLRCVTSEEGESTSNQPPAEGDGTEDHNRSTEQGPPTASRTAELETALAARDAILAELERSREVTRNLTREAEKVQFPERVAPEKITMTRKRKFGAWVGRPDRLTRISKHVEDALRRAFDDAIPEIEAQSGYTRASTIKRFAPETRVQGGALERRGDLASILSDMDAREIKWIQLGNGPSRRTEEGIPSISVTFGREPQYKMLGGGASVEVTGSDKQWVAATYDTLINELVKGVPWWSRLIAPEAIWGYIILCYVAVFGAAIKWVHPFDPTTALALGIAIGGLAWGLQAAVRWFLPDFELVESGESSKARKAGTFLIILVGLVSGIVTIWAFLRN
jgi:hypothetical protein